MTRKHKPQTTHKKRPSAHAPKLTKSAATHKAVAAVASLREKERTHAAHVAAAAARKGGAPLRTADRRRRRDDPLLFAGA